MVSISAAQLPKLSQKPDERLPEENGCDDGDDGVGVVQLLGSADRGVVWASPERRSASRAPRRPPQKSNDAVYLSARGVERAGSKVRGATGALRRWTFLRYPPPPPADRTP